MGDVSKDIFSLLTQLMPGFLTAWVVYGLTTYTKPAQFERIVQALIYSFMVSALVAVIGSVSLLIGKYASFGVWNSKSELVVSVFIALGLGVLLSYFMTNDKFYAVARRYGLTQRTPFPSEWYGAFAAKPPRYVVLHLDGDRRIIGYPIEWPTEPVSGHFKLTDSAWLDDKNIETPLNGNDSILIAAKQVTMVEFLKSHEELRDVTEAA